MTEPAERRSSPRSGALVRAGLLLSATGVLSAVSVRHSLARSAPDAELALGTAAALALVLAGLPFKPPRQVTLAALVTVALTYLVATIGLGGNALGLSLYVIAAALGYLATPAALRPLAVAGFALWTPALHLFGPQPTADFFPGPLAAAALAALAFLVFALLDRRAALLEERVRRVGLGLLAVAAVSAVVERHLVVASPAGAPDDVMAILLVALMPLLAYLPRLTSPGRLAGLRDALATGLALATYVLVALALLTGKGYHVDAVVAPHRAAELLLAGADPYRSFDLLEAARRFGLDPALVTHFGDGSQVRAYDYPALSFLVVAPFVAAGLDDVRWVYVAELILLVLLVGRHAAVPWRPLVVAAVVGNVFVTRQYVLAGIDPTWALLAVVAWVELPRRRLSPIALGLALASRQTAWFLAPFYLLAAARRYGPREAARRAALVALAALLPNLPFLVDAPVAFVTGVATPVLAALEPDGVGLVRFALEGFLPLFPREVYGLLAAVCSAGFAVLLWVSWGRVAGGALALPLVPLYLAWRSLQSYFALVPLFALVADEELLPGSAVASPAERGCAESRGDEVVRSAVHDAPEVSHAGGP